MKGWRLVAVPVLVGGAIAVGCSNGDTPVQKVAIASALTGTATDCRLSTISSIQDPPGMGVLGIGNTNSLTIQDGSAWLGGTVKFQCSIIPKGDGSFAVTGRAELKGVTEGRAGTFNLISGTFRPKANGVKPADSNDIHATLTTGIIGALTQMDCVGAYDGMDESGNRCFQGMTDSNGKIICTQNNTMDLKPPTEDSKSAAIWGTVFCSAATDSSQNPPRICKTAVTFRFENCPSEAPK
jgi:hypothetical protein